MSLFTRHPTNVAEVALQAHKEGKSGTPKGSNATTSKGRGKGEFEAVHPHYSMLTPQPDSSLICRYVSCWRKRPLHWGSPQDSSEGEIITGIVHIIMGLILLVSARG